MSPPRSGWWSPTTALIRTGIATLLDSLDDLELVGDAADGEALLAVVEATRPDVVVMDVNMAGMDGITATRLVLERHPEVVVLVLSMVEDDASLAAAIEAKASGYILKASTTDQLPHAIRTVAAEAPSSIPGWSNGWSTNIRLRWRSGLSRC